MGEPLQDEQGTKRAKKAKKSKKRRESNKEEEEAGGLGGLGVRNNPLSPLGGVSPLGGRGMMSLSGPMGGMNNPQPPMGLPLGARRASQQRYALIHVHTKCMFLDEHFDIHRFHLFSFSASLSGLSEVNHLSLH